MLRVLAFHEGCELTDCVEVSLPGEGEGRHQYSSLKGIHVKFNCTLTWYDGLQSIGLYFFL